jgi:hypothetical protein
VHGRDSPFFRRPHPFFLSLLACRGEHFAWVWVIPHKPCLYVQF